MKIIYKNKNWQLHGESAKRLIFRAENTDGKKVLAWRTKKKLNQRDAAEQLGISQGQLARIESGTRSCPPELLALLR